MKTEPEWRPIQSFPGYEVSGEGQVRSWYRGTARILKPCPLPTGYLRVFLCRAGPKRRHTRYIHTLVLEAFHGARQPGMEARHLDGNRENNRSDNLRFGTRSDNQLDNVRHGVNPNTMKTCCPKGHPYDTENTYISTRGGRHCRTCMRAHHTARRRAAGMRPRVLSTAEMQSVTT
jgi:hypothetical protein